MIASLPMYDFPEVRDATDALWSAIATRVGTDVLLDRMMFHSDVWRRPDMVFSQTCGYPFSHEFRGQLTYVATPHYQVEGCEGPLYSSMILARVAKPIDEFHGCVAAVNAADSMSGMLALKLALQGYSEVLSGSHGASMELVRSGGADICAVDCVTYALLRRYRPAATQGLVAIARSPLVPGLPYVTRAGDVCLLRAALIEVFSDPALQYHRETLMISGISVLDAGAYDVIIKMENS